MFKCSTKPTSHSFTHTSSACQAVPVFSTAANGGRLHLQAPKWPFIGTDGVPSTPTTPGDSAAPTQSGWLSPHEEAQKKQTASETVSRVKQSKEDKNETICFYESKTTREDSLKNKRRRQERAFSCRQDTENMHLKRKSYACVRSPSVLMSIRSSSQSADSSTGIPVENRLDVSASISLFFESLHLPDPKSVLWAPQQRPPTLHACRENAQERCVVTLCWAFRLSCL